MRLSEELKRLHEIDELVPVKKGAVEVVGDDLNAKLLRKIKIISDALAHAFEQEGLDLDAKLIADDIIRDCGLMGDIVSTDELDVEHNPFDAATKAMHDAGPVDTNRACQMLLDVDPHEFVAVFMNGLRRNRGLLPGGPRALPRRPEPRRLGGPRRLGESKKDKDYSYILDLAKKYSAVTEDLEDVKKDDEVPEDHEGQMEFLVKDEDEAIKGYDEVIAKTDNEHLAAELEHIKDEEIAHKEFLEKAKKDPDAEYEHAEEEVEVEVEAPAEAETVELELGEEMLAEKITDLKGYYGSSKNKEKFEKIGMSEKDWMKLADIDPTHKKGSNGGGSYIEWLLRLLTTGVTTFREMMAAAHEYTDQLKAFDDLKTRKRLPENKRDIMQVKNLEDLMNLVVTRGSEEEHKDGDEKEDSPKTKGSMSDFKQDLQDFPALCQKLTWPEPVEGTYEDHMELVGENDKWEVWKVKSPLGAFVFDQWGDGAKWCVGGFGYKGAEGKRSAESYYNNYLNGGKGVYVCFQQKNKNEPRPRNKALITFNDESRYSVSQFNHSNNSAYYGGGYSANTSEEFARFLSEENLLDVLKGTEFGNCESIKDVETAERLKNGEPYLYGGEKVKDQFKSAITKVVFAEDYNRTIRLRKQDSQVELIGIPEYAFKGCVNLVEVDMPIKVEAIGFHAFLGCDKATIKTPAHKVSCFPQDVEYIKAHMVYTDEKPKEEKPE